MKHGLWEGCHFLGGNRWRNGAFRGFDGELPQKFVVFVTKNYIHTATCVVFEVLRHFSTRSEPRTTFDRRAVKVYAIFKCQHRS